ncbi:Holliday junction branch migration protein RuvA [Chungangia koreensis]|uniref:Holliday junction branch migration complex subunit RuvA n=1 Tax=Chungangia koreensis TaxID=752657 RepID=A0ABV8X1V5_9LACT
MYDYIRGQVVRITPEYIVVDQNGIGWQIMTPNPYSFRVSQEPELIYTHLHVREDIQQLLGFRNMEQRELFRKLILVSGIGPKGALAILASGVPAQVIGAIEREDDAFLTQFPGVGKKTARQMILDLKGKLNMLLDESDLEIHQLDGEGLFASQHNHELEEALLALTALGYSERELNKIKPKLEDEQNDTETYMKKALQLLLKQ